MEQAVKHCTQGVGIWDWASSDAGEEPDIVMACCGDTPTLVHELTYERTNRNLSVHGYQEEGTITTPFDMRVQNEIDRFSRMHCCICPSWATAVPTSSSR